MEARAPLLKSLKSLVFHVAVAMGIAKAKKEKTKKKEPTKVAPETDEKSKEFTPVIPIEKAKSRPSGTEQRPMMGQRPW